MKLRYYFFIFLPIIVCSYFFPFNPQQTPGIKLKLIAKDVASPVSMDSPKDGSGRLFICEQTGKIKIIKNGAVLVKPFLDVSSKLDKINRGYSEKGLLGLAFHPNYKSNGRFFIYYSAPTANSTFNHKSVIAEYMVSPDANVAGAEGRILMEIEQPESNHNGGQLAFGPDGFLYIGVGDGGGAGDDHGKYGNGQELNTLLGKILRIDVNGKVPYDIPADNPFAKAADAKPEIYAYGLRNPWRFSFDRKTGKLFCGDVGQDKWEEIDIIHKGKNYGWRIMEGNHCFKPSTNCNPAGLEIPVAEYSHSEGISVTGGYVYNGSAIPALQGKYVFADWNGKMFYLDETGGKYKLQKLMIADKKNNDAGSNINSFGEGENGELYILTQRSSVTLLSNGSVYQLQANSQ